MNLVYLIIAHKNPSQILRLIERLDSPNSYFVIHIDKKSKDVYRELARALANHSRCHFAKRISVSWGAITLVEAKIMTFQKLCQLGIDFDFAIVCSGQDYPLKNNTEIRNKLEQYRGKELLDISRLPRETWGEEGGFGRFNRYHFLVGNYTLTFPPYTTTGWKGFIARISPEFLKKRPPLPFGYVPYGGADWYCLTKESVSYINHFLESQEGRKFLNRFRYTSNSSEIVYHTLLGNSPFKDKIANYFPWHIDWSANNPNPAIFTHDRFEELANSDKLFARKFDINVDSKILDMIDEHLLE
ncbi:MAG: hypothetical protein JXJ17_16470 [Anaerolineae bacterium]|nr:hypothetical protein [Anaerolineae bacterium]